MNSHEPPVIETAKGKEEEPEPPRNFTAKQLSYFDGDTDEKTGESKPIYMSVNGTVFDVSEGRNFYGPDGKVA
jgi:membrane-associated progesterone receptor component